MLMGEKTPESQCIRLVKDNLSRKEDCETVKAKAFFNTDFSALTCQKKLFFIFLRGGGGDLK